MLRMQSFKSSSHQLLILAWVVTVLLQAWSPAQAADALDKPKDIAAGLELTVAEARFLRGIEKKLVTRLNEYQSIRLYSDG